MQGKAENIVEIYEIILQIINLSSFSSEHFKKFIKGISWCYKKQVK